MNQPYIQAHANKHTAGEQSFYCVYSFSTDFILEGIFSKAEEAQAFHEQSPRGDDGGRYFPPFKQTFNQVADQIASVRLGVLAGILFPKETEALESASRVGGAANG